MGQSKQEFMEQRELESQEMDKQEIEKIQEEEPSEYYKLIGRLQKREESLSYSSLKQFYTTPKNFINYKLKKFIKSPAMIFGSLLDCLILTPEDFDKNFIVLDTVPSTDNQLGFVSDFLDGKTKEDAFANNYKRGDVEKVYLSLEKYIKSKELGLDVISQSDLDKAESIKESVLNNPTAKSFLERVETIQEKLEWEYKGYKFKGFLDVRGKGFIMDLKYKGTSSDINKFQWDFKDLHYDLQAGMYTKAINILGLDENVQYFIMVYDAKGEVSVIEIDYSYIAHGQQKYDFCIQEMERCRKDNLWNLSHDFYGINEGVFTMVKPRFAELKGSLRS